jgi:hypothetical protein
MEGPMPNRGRIDRELLGEPLVVGSHTVQLVARVGGWYGASRNAGGHGFGGWLHVIPSKVIVHGGDGQEQSVAITDATAETLRGMAGAAIFLIVACTILLLIGKRVVSSDRPT